MISENDVGIRIPTLVSALCKTLSGTVSYRYGAIRGRLALVGVFSNARIDQLSFCSSYFYVSRTPGRGSAAILRCRFIGTSALRPIAPCDYVPKATP